jgi:hypothetical protein
MMKARERQPGPKDALYEQTLGAVPKLGFWFKF